MPTASPPSHDSPCEVSVGCNSAAVACQLRLPLAHVSLASLVGALSRPRWVGYTRAMGRSRSGYPWSRCGHAPRTAPQPERAWSAHPLPAVCRALARLLDPRLDRHRRFHPHQSPPRPSRPRPSSQSIARHSTRSWWAPCSHHPTPGCSGGMDSSTCAASARRRSP